MLAIDIWDCSTTVSWVNANSVLTINILVLRASCLDCLIISQPLGPFWCGVAAAGTIGAAAQLPTIPFVLEKEIVWGQPSSADRDLRMPVHHTFPLFQVLSKF